MKNLVILAILQAIFYFIVWFVLSILNYFLYFIPPESVTAVSFFTSICTFAGYFLGVIGSMRMRLRHLEEEAEAEAEAAAEENNKELLTQYQLLMQYQEERIAEFKKILEQEQKDNCTEKQHD